MPIILVIAAVVVPGLLALQEEGYGVAKGIPTLVIAASSVDDVLAISAFTVLLGITFKPNTNLVGVILQVSRITFLESHSTDSKYKIMG